MSTEKQLKNMNPLVSIVIPVYNGANFMREAIDSALAQTYENIEIIVINDGSNDDDQTRTIALSYGNKISYYEKENGGVSTALNLGIKKMHGKYFSWLSHDDWYKPNKIEYEVEALREIGDSSRVVFSACDFVDWPSGNIEKTNYLRYGEKFAKSGWFAVAFGLISGCTLLIPKAFFEKYGNFDEKLRGVQDYKKWFEMFRNEHMIYIDKTLVCSRVHAKQVTYRYDRMAVEEDCLYSWIAKSLREDEMHQLGLSLYLFYGSYLSRWFGTDVFEHTKSYIVQQMKSISEPDDGNDKRLNLSKKLRGDNHRPVYVYCAGMYGRNLLAALRWRDCPADGVVDSNAELWGRQVDDYKCISYKYLPKDALIIVANSRPSLIEADLISKGFKHVKSSMDLDFDLLMTPINKDHCELLSQQ